MLKSELEKVKQEKDGIDFKIKKFDKASKDLDQLLRSQITDKSKKCLGYSTVPPPHPLIYNRPNKLDLSYSGLDEFKEHEFKGYGLKDSEQESNVVCDKESENSKDNFVESFIKEQVSQDKSGFVESSPNVDKETFFPINKIGKPQHDDKGFVDSGCSRHMTGNIAYLSDFKEFDKGYVSFGGDTGCLVLSLNFKLPDENQILLKIPRNDNMYSFDMKNIVPKEILTCLVAEATYNKAFRVYNTRTRRVEENLHIGFLKNKPMIEGDGSKWLFDIDSLTQSMNYVPVTICTVSSDSAGLWINGESKNNADDAPLSRLLDGPNIENAEQERIADVRSIKMLILLGITVNSTSLVVNTGKACGIPDVECFIFEVIFKKKVNDLGSKCLPFIHGLCINMDPHEFLHVYLAENYYCQANVNAVEITWAPNHGYREIFTLDDAEGTDSSSNATIFKEWHDLGYEKPSQKPYFFITPFSLPQWKVLDLQKAKDAQAQEIVALKKRIQRLERKKLSRPTGLKRLRKVGMSRRVESSEDQESLGAPEDASKQGRSIADIDADVEVTLVDETQERQDDDLMFDSGVLDDVEMPVEAKVDGKDEQSTKPDDSTAGEAVTTASVEVSVVPTTIEEITLAQTLIQIKAAKPKVVTTAATTTITRPKDRGVVFREQSEFRVPQETQPSSSKDKGKGIMIEPEVPLKRKDQIALDEQIARDIQAKLDAELIEEQKLARKQEEEANFSLYLSPWGKFTSYAWRLIDCWSERLIIKEREELTDEEKAKLFMEPMEKRRKYFAALRAQEKRNRSPTKAQKRTQMYTYLKHMGGYTYKQLKGKSFNEIQKLFNKKMKRVNTFVAMGSEKVEEEKESDTVDEYDEAELKKLLAIKKDEDITIDAIPLATKLPLIIDYKLHKEGWDCWDLKDFMEFLEVTAAQCCVQGLTTV
ncbi:hypothetical protein Tco_1133234 [Tanacetum coccineum]